MQVEKDLGYSTEAHWEKCLKKYGKKDKGEDVGGEALEMAFRRSIEKRNEPPKQPYKQNTKKENVQLSLFDIMK